MMSEIAPSPSAANSRRGSNVDPAAAAQAQLLVVLQRVQLLELEKLEAAEKYSAKQAKSYEERVRDVESEWSEKLMTASAQHRAYQEQFDARLQRALERSEAAIAGKAPPPASSSRPRSAKAGGFGRSSSTDAVRSSSPNFRARRPVSGGFRRTAPMAAKSADEGFDDPLTRAQPNSQLYNNRAVPPREDKTGMPLRLQAAGQRMGFK